MSTDRLIVVETNKLNAFELSHLVILATILGTYALMKAVVAREAAVVENPLRKQHGARVHPIRYMERGGKREAGSTTAGVVAPKRCGSFCAETLACPDDDRVDTISGDRLPMSSAVPPVERFIPHSANRVKISRRFICAGFTLYLIYAILLFFGGYTSWSVFTLLLGTSLTALLQLLPCSSGGASST